MNLLAFDIDGTLTETAADDDRLYAEALREVSGFEGELLPWERWGEVTDPAIARTVLDQVTGQRARDADVMRVRQAFLARWEKARDSMAGVRAIPGALEIVRQARERRDLCVAVTSGGWGPTAAMKLEAAGFPVAGLVLVTADDAEDRPAIIRTAEILAAAERGTFGFSHVVVVGDGVWDARAARTVGAGFVGIAREPAEEVRLRAEGAAAVVPHYDPPEKFWAAYEAALARQRAQKAN